MEKLFQEWLDSMDTSKNIIEHLKGQKSFHLRFLKFVQKKDEQASDVSPAILDEMIDYIEGATEIVDGEWGSCRNVKQLIKDDCMPDLYDKLIALKK